MVEAAWGHPVDICNVGAMIWDVFEGGHLFYGQDSSREGYTTRAHLAEVVGLLGPPPLDILERGVCSTELFSEYCTFCSATGFITLVVWSRVLEGRNKVMFLDFAGGMLAWQPEDRKTARQLLEDP